MAANSNQNNQNIFFYAKDDKYSVDLYNILKRENIINNFKMICINELTQIPKGVQAPTLVINGVPKLLVQQEAFKWVASFKFMKNQQLIEQNKKLIQQKLSNSGPLAFVNSEMSGLSDNYAFTDIDLSQPKAYCGYGKDTDNIIYTADESTKLSKEEQNRKILEMQNSRKKEETQYQEQMKQEHKEALKRSN